MPTKVLPIDLCAELQDPGIVLAGNESWRTRSSLPPEVGRIESSRSSWAANAGIEVVNGIKCLEPKLKLQLLVNLEATAYRSVEVEESGRVQEIAAYISESARSGRGDGKRRGIQPLVAPIVPARLPLLDI